MRVGGDAEQIVSRLRQLALYPAVAVAVMDGSLPNDFRPAAIAPNVLLAQSVEEGEEFIAQPWAQSIWANANDARALEALLRATYRPIVAVRSLTLPLPLDQARAECDRLQRDLAGVGQFAGYIV